MPIIEWLLGQHYQNCIYASSWADLGRLARPPKVLPERIKIALDLYPCDLLFIHRDAEREGYDVRHAEILNALEGIQSPPVVCVIPVRMIEAWCLIDIVAIRKASGNPNGNNALDIPRIEKLEQLPNPKLIIKSLIESASGLNSTRIRKLKIQKCIFLVSKYIDNFDQLRQLNSFKKFEEEFKRSMGIAMNSEIEP